MKKFSSSFRCRLNSFAAVAALLLTVVLCGCAPTKPWVPRIASKYELVANMKTQSKLVSGYRAEDVRVNYRDDKRKYSASGYLGFLVPFKLHLYLESFGYEFLVISDGDNVYMVSPEREHGGRGTVRWGPVKGDYAFRPGDIINALGIIDIPALADVRIEKYPREYILVFLGPGTEEGGITKRITVERQFLRISRVQTFTRDGELFMEADLSDYDVLKDSTKNAPVVAVPHTVHIRWPIDNITIKLRLKAFETDIDPAMFDFPKSYSRSNGYRWIKIDQN